MLGLLEFGFIWLKMAKIKGFSSDLYCEAYKSL